MSSKIALIIFVSLLLTFSVASFSQPKRLSNEELMESIRKTVGKPELKLVEFESPWMERGRERQVFVVEDGSWYSVYTDTGELCGYGAPRATIETLMRAQKVLLEEEAQKRALEWLAKVYLSFKRENMVLVERSYGAIGYSFHYYLKIEGTELICGSIFIDVHPETGEICSYLANRPLLQIPLEPRLTKTQALKIAQEITERDDEPELIHLQVITDELGDQFLAWNVWYPSHRLVFDDRTGGVLSLDVPGGGGGINPEAYKLYKPALIFDQQRLDIYWLRIIDGIAYLPIKAFELLGAKLNWISKDKVTIEKYTKQIVVDMARQLVGTNKARVYNTNGRKLVPLRPVCAALGLTVNWQPKPPKAINIYEPSKPKHEAKQQPATQPTP